MADGKPGRRPDSSEMKAAKARLREAGSDEARVAAAVAIETLKVSELAARTGVAGLRPAKALSEDEQFALLIEREPHLREAEAARSHAAERLRAEHEVLAVAFGGRVIARRALERFRRAKSPDGEAEARELLALRERLANHESGDGAPPRASAEMHAAA